MAEPVIPITDPDTGERADRRPLLCEYCECKLSRRGEVLTKSARAKALARMEDDLEAAQRTAAKLEADLTAARRDLEEARAALARNPSPEPEPARGPSFSWR